MVRCWIRIASPALNQEFLRFGYYVCQVSGFSYSSGKDNWHGWDEVRKFRHRSSAQIQISVENVVFPGTRERVAMVSGSSDHVLGAMAILLNEMLSEDEDEHEKKGAIPNVRLAVPKKSCGSIIGRNAEILRSLIKQSHAGINVSPVDDNRERLVTVTGNFESQLKAVELLLEKLIEDVNYQPNLTCPFPYGGVVSQRYGAQQPHGSHVALQSYGHTQSHRPLVATQSSQSHRPLVATQSYRGLQASRTIGIDDAKIHFVIGVQGCNLKAIMQTTGTHIQISDRGVFMPGTSNRMVTISGGRQAVDDAEAMILNTIPGTT